MNSATDGRFRNLFFFTGVVVCVAVAAIFAYFHPSHIETAGRAAISSLSIIFGLSTAVTSLLAVPVENPADLHNDPHLAKQIQAKIERDNRRTLNRQNAINTLAILSIVFGLVYLTANSYDGCSTATRFTAALFAASSTLCLLSALMLPHLLKTLFQRNTYLANKRSKP